MVHFISNIKLSLFLGFLVRRSLGVVGSLIFILLLSSCGNNNASQTADGKKRIVFRYGHAQTADDPRSKSMDFFKKELESKTNERIKVELGYSNIYGSEQEMMDLVKTGGLQGTRGGSFQDANIKYNIVTLPYLTRNWDQAICLVRSDWINQVAKEAKKNGFYIPACGVAIGFRAHAYKKENLNNFKDVKGLKIRAPGAQEIYQKIIKSVGANPVGVAWSETYSALKTGVVDGVSAIPAGIWDSKLYEALKTVVIDKHSITADPLYVNLNWYQSLPDDLKAVFDEVSEQTMRLSDELFRAYEKEVYDLLEGKLDLYVLNDKEMEEMVQLTSTISDFFTERGDFTKEDIDQARRAASGCDDLSTQKESK